MKLRQYILGGASVCVLTTFISSCGTSAHGNYPGREYIPDMAHGIAYEANYSNYNTYNKEETAEEYRRFVEPRMAVKGSIPRGGFEIYRYENTDTSRSLAIREITNNPIEPTTATMAKGKQLYDIYCGVCHGQKADGNGVLWNDGNGPYPNAPANLTSDEFIKASEGRYYHTIMHGKGVMGSYKDKLSVEERWAVIHHIRSLQAESKGEKYGVKAVGGTDEMKAVEEALKSSTTSVSDTTKNKKTSASVPAGITLSGILFDTGKATLKTESYEDLDILAKLLEKYTTAKVEISGHTDDVGKADANLKLSDARAKAVVTYLAGKGIAADRLIAKGYGQTKPVADNKTADGRAKNRRTEFAILK